MKGNRLLFVLLRTLVISLFFASPVWAADWIMPVQKADLSPFKHFNGAAPGGIEIDIVAEIAHRLNVPLNFKTYPIAQGRKAFVAGKVNIDCCQNPIWFPDKEAQSSHLFSDPIYRLMEVWVFPKGKSFLLHSVEDLKNKRVIGITGFNYPGEENFSTRLSGKDPLEVLTLLSQGKGDIAVLERHAAAYHINKRKIKAEFGPLYYAVDVSLRLHKSLKRQIPAINKAIQSMKDSGLIDDIIKRNLY